ncbi:MAG: hypothetical protein ACJAY2_002332 [Pseudomonadales bacterium]
MFIPSQVDTRKVFTHEGGKLIQAEVQDIHKTNNRVSHVDTDQGGVDCSRAVITLDLF